MKPDCSRASDEWAETLDIGRRDLDSLRLLCRVAEGAGFLAGVQVLPLATGQDFLLTVVVAEDLVLASPQFTWSDLEPPDGMAGAEAARHVLGCLEGIARRTRAGLNAYTWLRVASELEQVRAILAQDPRT
jgi:hypothetical protein